MTGDLHAETRLVRQRFARFAAAHIAGCGDLDNGEAFPRDLWRRMGEAGLFRLGIPKRYGGSGGGWPALVAAGEALVASGGNLGLALSWLVQQAVARFLVHGFGDAGQRGCLLPEMARGNLTVAFAVSEPGHGAHPRHLATRALRAGDGFRLTGEKAYLTNGPIADLYVVVAVTSEAAGRKRFTAFLVPRRTPGLSVAAPTPLPFLRPSPHGGIELVDCPVPGTAILGEAEAACETMVIPFGGVEDLLMTGPILGALSRLEARAVEALRAGEPDRTLRSELGAAHALRETLAGVALAAAADLDRGTDPSGIPQTLAGLPLAVALLDRLTAILSRSGAGEDPVPARLQADLTALFSLGRRRLLARQERLGAALLSNPA